MKTNYLEVVNARSDVFTAWEVIMLILGIGCFIGIVFIAVIFYGYVNRFSLDDELHR